MSLGLFFFIRQGWKQDKRYILWNILYQLVNAPLPVVAALLPKLIIDELMGRGRMSRKSSHIPPYSRAIR